MGLLTSLSNLNFQFFHVIFGRWILNRINLRYLMMNMQIKYKTNPNKHTIKVEGIADKSHKQK